MKMNWIEIQCKKCGKKLQVQLGSFYGTGKKCPGCGTVLRPGKGIVK